MNRISNNINVGLIQHKSCRSYIPTIGDIVIKHGFFVRTKWFGVVNNIGTNGTITVLKSGMMRLLTTTSISKLEQGALEIDLTAIRESMVGSYTILQQDPKTSQQVWYV